MSQQAPIPARLQVLAPSRQKRQVGDVFIMQFPIGYVFGRVISTKAKAGSQSPDLNLIYIYDGVYDSRTPPAGVYDPSRLLVPPLMTNNQPWLRGYFETVENRPLQAGEKLCSHAFLSRSTGDYWDEFVRQVEDPGVPVGPMGVHSSLTIEDLVARAIGLDPTIA